MSDNPKVKTREFRIKGIRDVLMVVLEEGEWENEIRDLLIYIKERKDFFQSAKLAIDVGERKVKATQIADLRAGLSEQGVSLVAMFSGSVQTKNNARTFGLETDPQNIRVTSGKKMRLLPDGGENAIMYNHTLRSGAKVNFSGSVMVIGDVNPGAEVIAAGSVVVWGRIRGKVIAGSGGDEGAMICALEVSPLQLRIANIEAGKGLQIENPVKINCQDSELTFTAWKK
ncbi:MAG TPA: septum site-determining protein MinC [Anaerolineaceae bacterium]|nr:septum site-determining protein MinC [Anaerolineaceae bacterium]